MGPSLVAVIIVAALLPLPAVALVLRAMRTRNARQDAAFDPLPGSDGTMPVPVRALYSHGGGLMGGTSRNSMRPSLAIVPGGLRYRVFRETIWPFAEIAQVDLRRAMFGGVRLLFLGPGNRRVLAAEVGNEAIARAVLAALPRGLALSADAAPLRDGHAGAATTGLPRYRGPTR